MKEQLSNESIKALVAYRFQRAKETLAEVPFLKQQGYYNTAINRLYYACYYASVALLIKYGINPSTHAGVKQMIGLHLDMSTPDKENLRRILRKMHKQNDYEKFAELTAAFNSTDTSICKLINDEFYGEILMAISWGEPIEKIGEYYQLKRQQTKDAYVSAFDELKKIR